MADTIIHIISSLARGGAETLLIGVIKAMPQYEHRIISLEKRNEFPGALDESIITYLNLKGYPSLPLLIPQVRELVKPYHGKTIVHAHLFWANIISRLAVPRRFPLINSYHSINYGRGKNAYPLHAELLDRLTYQKRVQTICVSEAVRENVARYVGIHNKVQVLYNYIEDQFFQENPAVYHPGNPIRLVAVGNLKQIKNYPLAIDALHLLQQKGRGDICSLDILGSGPLEGALKQQALKFGLTNIKFLGLASDVASRLREYDVFLMTSSNEGFGIAVAEAMASGLPVLIPNLPVLQEVTSGHALFFNCEDAAALAAQIEAIYDGSADVATLADEGQQQARKFSKTQYLKKLDEIYQNSFRQLPGRRYGNR